MMMIGKKDWPSQIITHVQTQNIKNKSKNKMINTFKCGKTHMSL